MHLYTKGGDFGETGLFGGKRVSKSDSLIKAIGSIDELNSFIGLVRTECEVKSIDSQLYWIQNLLFDIGAVLANPKMIANPDDSDSAIKQLENWIDEYEDRLQPLRQFILPGGTKGSALTHISRTVCRRAERELVGYVKIKNQTHSSIVLLNRLSDYLFILARQLNAIEHVEDVQWVSSHNHFSHTTEAGE